MTQDQSQPNTQPLDKLDMESVSQALEEGVWGQLYPHCGSFPRIPLVKDVFRFGRASSCDYVIREKDMGDMKWLTAVSKNQCEIFRDKKRSICKRPELQWYLGEWTQNWEGFTVSSRTQC